MKLKLLSKANSQKRHKGQINYIYVPNDKESKVVWA